jgi:DNA-binding XRE family transcriptional regulator
MGEAARKDPKDFLDPGKRISRVDVGGVDYVLMPEETYQQMLEEIESLDSALDLERAQARANLTVSKVLLRSKYTPQQVQRILEAPDAGRMIALMREVRGLSQEELANHADVSQATISNIENGRVQFRGARAAARVLEELGVDKSGAFALLTGPEVEAEAEESGEDAAAETP